MSSEHISYETLGFFVGQLVLFGVMLWKFYSIIQKHVDDKFNQVDKKLTDIKTELKEDITEIKADVKELKRRVEKLEEKVNVIDKEVHVFAVFLTPRIKREARKELEEQNND